MAEDRVENFHARWLHGRKRVQNRHYVPFPGSALHLLLRVRYLGDIFNLLFPEAPRRPQGCLTDVPQMSLRCPSDVPQMSRRCPADVPRMSRRCPADVRQCSFAKVPILPFLAAMNPPGMKVLRGRPRIKLTIERDDMSHDLSPAICSPPIDNPNRQCQISFAKARPAISTSVVMYHVLPP